MTDELAAGRTDGATAQLVPRSMLEATTPDSDRSATPFLSDVQALPRRSTKTYLPAGAVTPAYGGDVKHTIAITEVTYHQSIP